jgi:predicted amino acid dehydrogenase
LKSHRAKIRERILATVLETQKEVNVIGLGALTKAEWLTKGGEWIVDKLGDRLQVPIVHGDTLTAAAVIKQVNKLMKDFKISNPIFITGATSKIGRAVVLELAGRGIKLKMLTESGERFKAIQAEAGEYGQNLKQAFSLKEGTSCSLWITGKAVPGGRKLIKVLPKNAVVVNFSVPNPLTDKVLRRRPDLYPIEGGLLSYDPAKTDLNFTMRLKPGLTYACHAGTMVHAYKGWTNHEVGVVELSKLHEVWEAATELGFFLPKIERLGE